MQLMLIAYLASPYSHPSEDTRYNRFVAVTKMASRLKNAGIALITPITSSVPMAIYGDEEDTGWATWRDYDLELLANSDALVVYKLPGYRESTGVQAEIRFARHNKIPIYYLEDGKNSFNKTVARLHQLAREIGAA